MKLAKQTYLALSLVSLMLIQCSSPEQSAGDEAAVRRLNSPSRTKEKSMNKNVLLVGRKRIVLDDVRKGLAVQDVTLFSGTTLDDVRKVLDEHSIDMVIMGAGIDLEIRLQIVRHIFEASNSTTVHMKDSDSGPQGFLPFVNGVLKRPE